MIDGEPHAVADVVADHRSRARQRGHEAERQLVGRLQRRAQCDGNQRNGEPHFFLRFLAFHNCFAARSAPSRSASNFAHITVGCTSGR